LQTRQRPLQRASALCKRAGTTNKVAMPYVLMFAAMLMLTMLVSCVVMV
jgi:hypothetical protein